MSSKKSTASKNMGAGYSAGAKLSGFKKAKSKGPHSRISDAPRKSSTGGLNHSIGSKKGS